MKSSAVRIAIAVLAHAFRGADGEEDLVLDQRMMQMTSAAASLSRLAYMEDPDDEGWSLFDQFHEEPDQAILTRKNGYCYVAFRGTIGTWDDWMQNLSLGNKEVCGSNGEQEACCTTRLGFWKAYNNDYRQDLEASVRACAEECDDPDECVVLTGHSQGGAVAAVASLQLADLNPYVVSFGSPPAVDEHCALANAERWYRYVNSRLSSTGIAYDPVSFLPGLGADDLGRLILLSDDSTSVAYLGLNVAKTLTPWDLTFAAHFMTAGSDKSVAGYLDRVNAILENYSGSSLSYPVQTTGFASGALCGEDEQCQSGLCDRETGLSFKRCAGFECSSDSHCTWGYRCDNGACVEKLGSCAQCNEHSDCQSGHCSWRFRCAANNGLMDDGCLCSFTDDCQEGSRCDGISPRICSSKLEVGERCNEHSDCVSDRCSWMFRCAEARRLLRA